MFRCTVCGTRWASADPDLTARRDDARVWLAAADYADRYAELVESERVGGETMAASEGARACAKAFREQAVALLEGAS